MSADEDVLAIAKVVELSLSESQPFNRFVQHSIITGMYGHG